MSANPSYRIETGPRKDYMRLTFWGLMDHATTDQFEQELADTFALRRPAAGGPSDWLFLADVRAAGMQSRDISARLQSIMARYGSLTRRTAMLMSGSALEMMQARRVAGRDGTGFFRDEDEAAAWLFGEEASVG